MANVVGFLRKAFPFLAAGLQVAGPAGNLAAAVLQTALKLDPKDVGDPADPTKVQNTIAGMSFTPDQQVAMQQAELSYQTQMTAMGYKSVTDLEDLALQDRESARNREVATKDLTPRVLGTSVLGAFVVAVFLVLSGHAKADTVLAGTLIGYLSAKAELVLTYYFGSSAGSDRKTELMAQQNKR